MSAARVRLAALGPAAPGLLQAVAALLRPGEDAWLVGGAVRQALEPEALRGRESPDLDLALSARAIEVGRALADRLGGAFVLLDEARGTCRVLPPGAPRIQLDLADLRAPGIEGDLRGRDFTIDALAVPLRALLSGGAADVLDPLGGLADLSAGRVRLCSPHAVREDPVRALRAVRFGTEPGWTLDPAAAEAVRAAAPAVAGAAAERLRDELGVILSRPGGGRALRLLDGLGVLPVLLPESLPMRATPQPEPHRFDVWEHSLRTVEAADRLAAEARLLEPGGEAIERHLAEEVGDGFTRRETLKLAALLHDVAKPETRTDVGGQVRFLGHDVLGAERALGVAQRLRLSNRAARVVERLVRQHLRPMHLAQAESITRRARHRFYRDLGEEALDLLLLAAADAAAVRGDPALAVWRGPGGETVRTLLGGLEEEAVAAAEPPVLRGQDVMAAFGLSPGPEVGRLLALAREAQALGLVRTREEAIAYLGRLAR